MAEAKTYPSMRGFCLGNSVLLERMLLFCSHAIRMRDTRCCGVILRVLRTIIPTFSSGTPETEALHAPIREFIGRSILSACISSFHEAQFVELQR